MKDDDTEHGGDGVPGPNTEDRHETQHHEPGDRDPGVPRAPAAEAREKKPVAPRYRIGETLGEGGMAVVQLATDTHLNRQVAVKRLRPELARQAEVRQRFFNETAFALEREGEILLYFSGYAESPDSEAWTVQEEPTIMATVDDPLAWGHTHAEAAFVIKVFRSRC
ncbi:MAG: hypothetical protein ACC742_10860 [Thermoanaerobaculales bacterium]